MQMHACMNMVATVQQIVTDLDMQLSTLFLRGLLIVTAAAYPRS